MSVNNATIQVERTSSYRPKRFPFRSAIVIGAATLAVAIVAVVAIADGSGQGSVRPTVQPARPAGDDVVRDLVNRGLIPSESLQPATPSRDDIVQDLVDRGLVPAATPDDVSQT